MTTPPDLGLRTSLHRVADAVEPLPVADDLWQRGQAARRRGQALVVAAVLAIVVSVSWSAVLMTSEDREARTASSPAPAGGAIPSRVVDPGELDLETDLAVGRASVAFFSARAQPVVVGASDGVYRALDLPDLSDDRGPLELSPDGRHLAWRAVGRIHVLDLDDGTSTEFPRTDEHAEVDRLAWAPNSEQLLWNGRDATGRRSGGMLPVGDTSAPPLPTTSLRGIPSPSGDLVALDSPSSSTAALFLPRRGARIERPLPADLYPDGAAVTPLGWTDDHLVLAQVYGPDGSYVEGQHLALFTSPDRPESTWTYRIVSRDVPQDAVPLSVAVDLVPDLDGTSSQVLTHDFDPPGDQRDISWLIGLGVAAAIAVMMALRWLWRRLVGQDLRSR